MWGESNCNKNLQPHDAKEDINLIVYVKIRTK